MTAVGTNLHPECPLSRRDLEDKGTCHGDRESDVHDPEPT